MQAADDFADVPDFGEFGRGMVKDRHSRSP